MCDIIRLRSYDGDLHHNCNISNLYRYSGFRSLKNAGSKNSNPPKPRYTHGLRTYALPTGVFASNGDREAKNRDFGGKMAKLEKVRYGCNAKQKRWRAHKYCKICAGTLHFTQLPYVCLVFFAFFGICRVGF